MAGSFTGLDITPFTEAVAYLTNTAALMSLSSEANKCSQQLMGLVNRDDESNYIVENNVVYPGYHLQQVLCVVEQEMQEIGRAFDMNVDAASPEMIQELIDMIEEDGDCLLD